MLIIVDRLDIDAAEQHRRDLRRVAAQVKQRRPVSPDPADEPVSTPLASERNSLLESLATSWAGSARREVECADPLGVWSWGYPARRSFVWPEWRATLDWGAWVTLILVAGYVAAR